MIGLSSPLPSPYEGKTLTVGDHLAIACFWFGTNFLWGSMIPLILPDAMERLYPANPALATGLLVSIGAINGLIIPLFSGALSDRCTSRHGRRKPFMLTGAGVFSIGALVMLLSFETYSIAGFVFGYFILNVGSNIATGAYAGLMPDVVPAEQRGTASGYMGVMTMLGAASGSVIIGRLLERGLSEVVYGLIILVVLLLVWVTYRKVPETPLPTDPPEWDWRSYIKSLWIDPRKYPDFAWVWITRALVMLGFYSIPHIVMFFLRDAVGVPSPKQTAGTIMAAVVGGAALSTLVAGMISDRYGRKRVVYLSNTFMGVTALGLAFSHNYYSVLAIAIVFGIGFGAYLSVDWALGADTLPTKIEAGKEMAVWHVAQELPHILAAVLAGAVLSSFRVGATVKGDAIYDPDGFSLIFTMAALFVLLGAFLLKNVRGVR
jgi:MFS family permease